MQTIKIKIEKLVHGGWGLGRTGNGVVFVSDVLPDETVLAEIIGTQGGTPLARVLDIIEPSACRRAPLCPLATTCGGCNWQHINYDAQLRLKQEIVSECLRRIGKISPAPAWQFFSANETAYRWRVQIKIDFQRKIAGFFKRSSNEVIAVKHCPVLLEPLNHLLAHAGDWIRKCPAGTIELRAITAAPSPAQPCALASVPGLAGLTEPAITLAVGSNLFTVTGDSFFQSNAPLCATLAAWAKPYIGGQLVYDLFGGVGLFSVCLGGKFTKGILVEDQPRQTALAQTNFTRNNVGHFSVLTDSVENFLSRTPAKPDCIIVDPPRAGLSPRARSGIAALHPKTLLYVSCDAATLARDAGFFIKQCGYTITQAALFDLYPQTAHCEAAIVLTA